MNLLSYGSYSASRLAETKWLSENQISCTSSLARRMIRTDRAMFENSIMVQIEDLKFGTQTIST